MTWIWVANELRMYIAGRADEPVRCVRLAGLSMLGASLSLQHGSSTSFLRCVWARACQLHCVACMASNACPAHPSTASNDTSLPGVTLAWRALLQPPTLREPLADAGDGEPTRRRHRHAVAAAGGALPLRADRPASSAAQQPVRRRHALPAPAICFACADVHSNGGPCSSRGHRTAECLERCSERPAGPPTHPSMSSGKE